MDTSELRVNTTELVGPQLARLQQYALYGAAAGAALFAGGYLMTGPAALNAYLQGYLLWIGATVGSIGLLALHHAVGGGWGFVLRRMLEAGTRMVPLMALLFIPIALPLFLDIPALFRAEFTSALGAEVGWAHPGARDDALIQTKAAYLNPGFFIARAAALFALWWFLGARLTRLGRIWNERSEPGLFDRLNRLGSVTMVLLVLSATVASVDWVMSLTPKWVSMIFGMLFSASWALTALALMVALVGYFAREASLFRRLPTGYFRDHGNLMLALTMLWAYMAFSQYLIIFSGNLTEEIVYYLDRGRGGWPVVTAALMLFHFFGPFFVLLLGSNIKRDPVRLGGVALWIVLMRELDSFWMVAPTFRQGLGVSLADIGAPLMIGGIWLWFWAREMKDQPLVPLHDPRFVEHMAHAGHEPGHGQEVVAHG